MALTSRYQIFGAMWWVATLAIAVKHPLYPILSPDGDRHHDLFQIPYRVDEPAHGVLYVQPAGGRMRRVEFTLGREELKFWNIDMKDVVEPAAVTVWIGPSSAEGSQAEFEITE